MDASTGPPRAGRSFYSIVPNGDGTADVYLEPEVVPITTLDGVMDYDVCARVVRGVDPCDEVFGGDLDGHIRAHYDDWLESGEEWRG